MENDGDELRQNEPAGLTETDFNDFLSATGKEQWKILLDHAERNKKIIHLRRAKTMEQYNDHRQEEIGKQFEEFCRTKGIAAKFKVAFADMAENTRRQRAADKARIEEIKRRSAEENPEFTEFLHTKGFKAKVRLVIQNLKNGCREASRKTAVAVDNISAQTRADIARAQTGVCKSASDGGAHVSDTNVKDASEYTAAELTRTFNEFLKEKGLDSQYVVEITDDSDD